jgi:hypothetical protein
MRGASIKTEFSGRKNLFLIKGAFFKTRAVFGKALKECLCPVLEHGRRSRNRVRDRSGTKTLVEPKRRAFWFAEFARSANSVPGEDAFLLERIARFAAFYAANTPVF